MIQNLINKTNEKFIVIIGCGRLGAYLANSLGESKYNSIVIIDKNEESFERLSTTFSGFTVEADALELDVLTKAKVKDADVVVVTTNHDNTNIMIAQIAKGILDVPKVIARLIDPSRERVYAELGIDTISPTALSAIEFKRIIDESGWLK